MNNAPFPVTLLLKRLPNTTFLDGHASLQSMSSIPSLSLGYSLIDASSDVFIGEKALFSLTVVNDDAVPVQILSIKAEISPDTGAILSPSRVTPLDEVVSSSGSQSASNTSNVIGPGTTKSFRYSKLIRDLGKHIVRVTVMCDNSTTPFVLTASLIFVSLKPFDLSFTRSQVTVDQYMISSTITNRLSCPMLLHSVSLQDTSKGLTKVLYNSFTKLTPLQPQQKLAHVIIVQGAIAENQPIGSLVIHFSAPGHGEIGLNSNQILVSNVVSYCVFGYYETPESVPANETTTVTAVVTNCTDKVQMIGLDWSKTKGEVMVVGECHFSKMIQPRKTIRIPIQILPLATGNPVLDPPAFEGKNVSFSSVSLIVL